MGNYLLAVLVPATATTTTIDQHLNDLLDPLIQQGSIHAYRLGGAATGAWDPGYDPEADPANWRTCLTCMGFGQLGGQQCRSCRTAVAAGRPAGTELLWNAVEWARHPGDIVPLPRLMDPDWRFPRHRSPDAWIDGTGTFWLNTTPAPAAEPVPDRLRRIFDNLLDGRRRPGADRQPAVFDPEAWSVAVVQAHH